MLGLANQENLSHLNFGGAGPKMLRKVAADHHVAAPEDLIATAKELGVRIWPCQMTMDLMGLRREDLIDGLGEPVGAATALAEMSRSSINLFI
jgi:peroxiredoxin family protein